MIKNIIFFIESPLSKRDFDRFGIQTLRNEGFDVDIWDLTPCLHRSFHSTLIVQDPVPYQNMRIFERKIDVIKNISELNDTDLVICFLGFDYNSLFVYRAISYNNIKYCVWQAVSLPVSIYPDAPRGFLFTKIIDIVKRGGIRSILYHAVSSLLKKHYRLFGVQTGGNSPACRKRSDESYISIRSTMRLRKNYGCIYWIMIFT